MAAEGYSLADGGERTRVNVGGKKLRPCGTYAAFQRHQKRDEEPCEACATAARLWRLYTSARKSYWNRKTASASPEELEALLGEMLAHEIDYRALERRSDTPQPPGRRWTVYRFDFENGQQYVGITQRSARAREAEHVSGDKRLTGGSARISELVADNVKYDLVTLATDLTEGEAYERERDEIAKLVDPLNIQGPVNRQPNESTFGENCVHGAARNR
jgi:predicted GIY-YIG superfamily endonuclease